LKYDLTHDVHKFAYRMLLVSLFLKNEIDSELLLHIIKTVPYILLSFDIILYSPREIYKRLINSRPFRLFLISAYLGITISSLSADKHFPPHHSLLREEMNEQVHSIELTCRCAKSMNA